MTNWTAPALTNVQGEGDPECEWDFAVWEGSLKITANCPGAYITLTGEQLDALEELLAHARGKVPA